MYTAYELTAEDLAIARSTPSRRLAMANAFLDGARDSAIMAELCEPSLGRATLAPVTLATIGLDGAEFRAIALGLPLPSDVIVTEHGPEDFEHVELCEHGQPIACDAVYPDSCEDCDIARAESASVPHDWFAGGFADNH